MCLCVSAYAGMLGGTHSGYNSSIVGRARSNVVYSNVPVAVSMESQGDVAETVIIDTPEPESVYESIIESEPDYTDEIAAATEYIAQLQAEIRQIDSEMARCRQAKTNWTIGTIVGSVGVVGTATGAIVQGLQINKAKKNGAVVSDTDEKDNAK